MYQLIKKSFQIKFALFLFLFSLLIIPAVAAETIKFDSYQRIKNITRQDPPAGVIYTAGQPGDIIKHLIFIYNQDNYEHNYEIAVTLPRYLELIPQTTSSYRDGWQAQADLNENFSVRLLPFESRYYRFSTKLSDKFPNENAILTTAITVQEDTGQARASTTKVYVPNYQPGEQLSESYQTLSAEEQERVKKLLEEERQFMEEQFFRLLKNNPAETAGWPEETAPTVPATPLVQPKTSSDPWLYLIALTVIAASACLYLRSKK